MLPVSPGDTSPVSLGDTLPVIQSTNEHVQSLLISFLVECSGQ